MASGLSVNLIPNVAAMSHYSVKLHSSKCMLQRTVRPMAANEVNPLHMSLTVFNSVWKLVNRYNNFFETSHVYSN